MPWRALSGWLVENANMMSAKLLFEKIFGDLGCWGGIGVPGMLLEKVVGNTIGQVCGRMGKWVYVRCHAPA